MVMTTHDTQGERLASADNALAAARGLGWFSIGLGLAELLAPRAMARALGMRDSETLLQAYGLREIVTGVGILSSRDPAPWVWGRVAGDALDIATLAPGLSAANPKRDKVGIALLAVAGVAVLDALTAQALNGAARDEARERRRRRYGAMLQHFRMRSGFSKTPDAMRGAARDFVPPRAFRTPALLKPWVNGRPAATETEARPSEP